MVFLNDNRRFRRPEVRRPLGPSKAYPPSVIDLDAVLASAVAPEGFKAIAGQDGQILQGCRRLKAVKLQSCGFFNAREGTHCSSGGEICRPFVAITEDYGPVGELFIT